MTTTTLIAEDEPLLAAVLRAELARLWPALLYFEAADEYVRVVAAEPEHLIRSRCASCCRSWTRTSSGRCTAAPWCRRAASPARAATSRARPC